MEQETHTYTDTHLHTTQFPVLLFLYIVSKEQPVHWQRNQTYGPQWISIFTILTGDLCWNRLKEYFTFTVCVMLLRLALHDVLSNFNISLMAVQQHYSLILQNQLQLPFHFEFCETFPSVLFVSEGATPYHRPLFAYVACPFSCLPVCNITLRLLSYLCATDVCPWLWLN